MINADEEEGGAKKEEGFTRLVARLLLLIGSGVSWIGNGGVEEADRGRDGTCKVGTGEGTTLGAWENEGTVIDG